MRSELRSSQRLTANFVPEKCGISSAGRIGFVRLVTRRRLISPKDLAAISIGFAVKPTCATTSARPPKFYATRASFIASGHHDSGRNYPLLHQARRLGPRDWCGLRTYCTKKAGLPRSRPRPLSQEGTGRKISAARNQRRQYKGGRFNL